MFRFIIFLSLLSTYFSALGQYSFTLEFKTKSFNNGKIYLNVFNMRGFDPILRDSFIVINGNKIIKGHLRQPSNLAELSVSYNGQLMGARFVIDSGINKISLDTPILSTKSLTLISNARGHIISRNLDSLFSKLVANYKEPVRVNGYLKIPKELRQQIRQAQLKQLPAYWNDFGGLLYLYRISQMDDDDPRSAMENLTVLSKFSEEVKNSTLGKQLYTKEAKLINGKKAAEAGKAVPVFKINDLDNQEFTNKSLLGKPYVIVFSATWCGPCQKQLPLLQKLYSDYKQKGLKVIYFNLDDDVKRWKEHVIKNKLTWINVSERRKFSDSNIQRSFGVFAIPTCIIVDRNGTITYNSDQSDPGLNKIETHIQEVI